MLDIVRRHSTAPAVNENGPVTDPDDVFYWSLQLKDKPVLLSYTAQRGTLFMKEGYKILDASENRYEHQQGCDAL